MSDEVRDIDDSNASPIAASSLSFPKSINKNNIRDFVGLGIMNAKYLLWCQVLCNWYFYN